MTSHPPQSPMSVGMAWASRITILGLELTMLTVGGSLLDRRFDTAPVATLIGAGLGLAVGLLHLIRIASPAKPPESPD